LNTVDPASKKRNPAYVRATIVLISILALWWTYRIFAAARSERQLEALRATILAAVAACRAQGVSTAIPCGELQGCSEILLAPPYSLSPSERMLGGVSYLAWQDICLSNSDDNASFIVLVGAVGRYVIIQDEAIGHIGYSASAAQGGTLKLRCMKGFHQPAEISVEETVAAVGDS